MGPNLRTGYKRRGGAARGRGKRLHTACRPDRAAARECELAPHLPGLLHLVRLHQGESPIILVQGFLPKRERHFGDCQNG